MKQIAEALLSIEAVTLSPNEPYTWSSGLKSPIYCDNRLTLSYPEVRDRIVEALVAAVRPLGADVIAGTATAGIPHATLLADRLNLPLVYVRSGAKKHGKGNQIEGRFANGARVVVIEDLLSTGKSSIEAAEAIRAAGGEVVLIQAIFSYGLDSLDANLTEANLMASSLTTFAELIEVARNQDVISEDDATSLAAWQENPNVWSKQVTR